MGGAIHLINTTPHRISNSVGLLMNLLQHIVGIFAFFYFTVRKINLLHHFINNPIMFNRSNLMTILRNNGHFSLIQVNYITRVVYNRGCITGQKIFIFSNSKNHWTSMSCRNHFIWLIITKGNNSIGTHDLIQCYFYRFGK